MAGKVYHECLIVGTSIPIIRIPAGISVDQPGRRFSWVKWWVVEVYRRHGQQLGLASKISRSIDNCQVGKAGNFVAQNNQFLILIRGQIHQPLNTLLRWKYRQTLM